MRALLSNSVRTFLLRSLNERCPVFLIKAVCSTAIVSFCFIVSSYAAAGAEYSARDVSSPAGPVIRHVNSRKSKKIYGGYLKSIFYAQEGEYDMALKELSRVKRLDPKSTYLYLRTASFLIRQGKVEQAEKELKKAKQLDADNIDVSLSLIFLYSYLQKDKELEAEYGEFLERAHKIKPDNIRISEYLAQFYFYKKRPRDAIKVYEAVVAGNPEYLEGVFWLGYLYSEVGRKHDAIEAWLKVLKSDPGHAQALNALAYTYAEEGIKLDEAKSMVKKALEKDPQNGAYMDTLAWVYFKAGEYAPARENLEKALKFLKDPVVYEHLGDVAVAEGHVRAAVEYYEQGLTNFPGNEALKEKLEKYGQKDKPIKK